MADKWFATHKLWRILMRELDLNELQQVAGGSGTNTGVSG